MKPGYMGEDAEHEAKIWRDAKNRGGPYRATMFESLRLATKGYVS
jgi:hypothetical protein